MPMPRPRQTPRRYISAGFAAINAPPKGNSVADTLDLERRLLIEESHNDCEDCWYSCALLTCNEHRHGDKCDCGADEQNALRKEAAAALASQRAEIEAYEIILNACTEGTEWAYGAVPEKIDALRQRVEELEGQAAELLAELANIALAKRFDRTQFDDDSSFADWAQSRARQHITTAPVASAALARKPE